MISILTNGYSQPDIPGGYGCVEWDMGCGRGGFTLALAKRYPERLVVASDVMLGRLRRLDAKVERQGLGNVMLLRAESSQAVRFQIPPRSIDRLHVLCPDPWPKDKRKARRLVCTAFLCMLPRVLKKGAVLHMSTDHMPYWEDWCGMLKGLPFFREQPDAISDVSDIRTDFERQWQEEGKEVRHLSFICTE